MCTYLKNMEGYKLKDLKLKEFDSIQEMFDRAFKRVNTFEDFRTELVEGKEKRAREELIQESSKKQKVDDDKETAELKQCMEIIPDEEEVTIDAIPLAVNHMLKSFEMEDLEDLYKLVKARYGSTRPVESMDYLLWNDMKIMIEPHVQDESMQIYMLVEKKYPLTPPTLSMMLEKKLQIDYESKMAYQLCKCFEASSLLEDYYSDNQYAVSIKEDTAYPCLHSPKTTKDTRPIRRIQRRSILRIEDIEENDNEKVNLPSLPSPEPAISCFDDLDFFKDIENEFQAIFYNDAQTSKSDLQTEPILSPHHIDEFDLNDETSLSECYEEEQNVSNFKDLFLFNVIYPNDSKSDKDNDDKVDIEHSSGDLSVKLLPDVINTDVVIMEYLVKISKRCAFWSLNEDILKITILTTNTSMYSLQPKSKNVMLLLSTEKCQAAH
ncbi:hypothetical protein Tco_0503627 [Tanacetum coccineum]